MGECIHDRFEHRASENPGGTALVHGDRRFAYSDLNALSNAVAQELDVRGVRPGDVVALLMNRSAEMIMAMLGVLKCGAAYMPLDPTSPVVRNRYYIDQARVRLIVADRDCRCLSEGTLKEYHFAAAELSTAACKPAGSFSTDTPAYVMFTSGTESEPKGVIVPHRAVTRLVTKTNYIDITPQDAVLHCSAPNFDASTFEIWGALLNGAKLVLYTGAVLDPNRFKQQIAADGVTIVWLTAALFHLFSQKYLDALRPLRVLLAGGDVVHPEAVVNVLEEIDGLTVINGYGPTENTTFTTCHVMTKDNRPDGTVPIGRPVTGTEVFILDDGRQPVRPGEIGELYVAGLGVALGYLKDDPQHSPYFYDKRFSDGLLYRTGDLVRLNEDSLIEFIGRRDRQVKVRGYRISLEEIRACLIELPEVKEAVVGCRKLASGDQLLLAHLQTEKDRTVSIGTVRTHLRSRLPSYMIPDRISTCTALPLTTSGKVDTKAVISNLNESEG